MKQNSFKNENNSLYIIPSPIGNMNDVSPSIIDAINKCEVIACEDTRVTGGLLSKLNIKKKMIVFADHNSRNSIKGILELLNNGNVGLMSDAGTPIISDPGYDLVSEVIANNFNVISIPGPVAFINALVASGISANKFTFNGFLPNKSSQKEKILSELIDSDCTQIFYESCHRIKSTCETIKSIFVGRKICIAREITKLHEEYIRCITDDLNIEDIKDKGEFVIVLEGKKKEKNIKINKYKNNK